MPEYTVTLNAKLKVSRVYANDPYEAKTLARQAIAQAFVVKGEPDISLLTAGNICDVELTSEDDDAQVHEQAD